jgi:hypothetical protein
MEWWQVALIVAGGVVVYVVCIVLTVAILIADSKVEYKILWRIDPEGQYRETIGFGVLFGLMCGPIALLIMFFTTGFAQHGLTLSGKID